MTSFASLAAQQSRASAVAHSRAPSRDRVALSDADTLSASELVPGDVFAHAGRLFVALSGHTGADVLHAHPYADRTAHVQLHISGEDEVLVFG